MVTAATMTADATQSGHIRLGELLLDLGKLTEIDIGRVVHRQRESNLKFGEAAQAMGLVTEEDVAFALARQFSYPCVRSSETSFSPLLVTALEPFSPAAEVIRSLRGHLMLSWFDDRRRALAITAPRRSQGSSVIAANLAIAFAQLGERTLLIDANLRHPSQQALFGLPEDDGLAHLLSGRAQFKQVLRPVQPFEALTILAAGVPAPNPHELLSSISFSWLVESAAATFDVIILDTPSLLDYPDAQVVAARTGGCLLSTRRHTTTLQDVEAAKRIMEPAGAMIVGSLIND